MMEVLNRTATPTACVKRMHPAHGAARPIGWGPNNGYRVSGLNSGQQKNITVKEMLPIVLGVAMCGKHCNHQHILVHIIITTTRSHAPIEVSLHFLHVESKRNVIADTIQRIPDLIPHSLDLQFHHCRPQSKLLYSLQQTYLKECVV